MAAEIVVSIGPGRLLKSAHGLLPRPGPRPQPAQRRRQADDLRRRLLGSHPRSPGRPQQLPARIAQLRHRRLPGRQAARRMQATVRVSGRSRDGAPDLATGPRLTPGCAQAGTSTRAAAFVRSPKPRMPVMRSPLTVRTCQRRAVPPASRAAGVPVTSSPTRRVPGRRSPQ